MLETGLMKPWVAWLSAAALLAGCPREVVTEFDGGPSDGGTTSSCNVAAQDCVSGSCVLHAVQGGGYVGKCAPGACDLIRQDCPAYTKCSYVSDGGSTATRGCTPEGGLDEGQPCSGPPFANTCRRGLICTQRALEDGGTGPICSRFCNSAADCTAPQVCTLVLSLAGTDERPLLCGPPPPSCDVFAQDCGAPYACYPSGPGGQCFAAGARSDGEACSFTNDCRRGSACVSLPGQPALCAPLCRYPSGLPSCANGSCMRLGADGAIGVCP